MELHTLRRPLVTVALFATSWAWGQTLTGETNAPNRLKPVEVAGKRTAEPRHDVQRACPDYQETLKSSLARRLTYVESAAEMQVVFQLKGNQVEKVEAQGGPYEIRQTVRRAVSSFACVNDGQRHQQYSFLIVFKPSEGIGLDSQKTAMRGGDALLAKRN